MADHMPSLAGATGWVNSEPLEPAGLRGRVVLVNFWTLTCINWLRQEPYVRAWSRAYRDDGLVVLGVHTPEFSFEHDLDLVRAATAEREIDYPVAADNDYGVWTAFANHYWPALYFVDREGVIRDRHFGEGRYEESERSLQRLLGIERDPVPVEGAGDEAEADWENLSTPETYLGSARGENFARPRRAAPQPLDRRRRVVDRAGEHRPRRGGREHRLPLPRARRARRALPGEQGPIPFRVRLDGEPPAAAHGVHVDEEGNGVLRDGRMYQLIREPGAIGDRTLEITFEQAGAEAYSFTFG